jgi:hypothetical protein
MRAHNIYDIYDIHIRWVPVGGTHEKFINNGNYPVIWIKNGTRTLRVLIASARTSSDTLAYGIKQALACTNYNIKQSERELIKKWIQDMQGLRQSDSNNAYHSTEECVSH